MIKRVARLHIETGRRSSYQLYELKDKLLKSLTQTHNNSLKHRLVYAHKARNKQSHRGLSRHQGLCLLTGRARGVIRLLGLSRHSLKRYALENKVQNIRIGSW